MGLKTQTRLKVFQLVLREERGSVTFKISTFEKAVGLHVVLPAILRWTPRYSNGKTVRRKLRSLPYL